MVLSYTILYRFNLLLNSLITILELVKVAYTMPCLVLRVLLSFLPLSLLLLPFFPFFVLLLLLHFLEMLQPKSFKLRFLLVVFFLLLLVLIFLASAIANMSRLVHVLHPKPARSALVGLVAT